MPAMPRQPGRHEVPRKDQRTVRRGRNSARTASDVVVRSVAAMAIGSLNETHRVAAHRVSCHRSAHCIRQTRQRCLHWRASIVPVQRDRHTSGKLSVRILLHLGSALTLLVACQAQAQTGLAGSAHLGTHSSMGFGLTAGQFGDAGMRGSGTSGQGGLETRFASELDTSPMQAATQRQRASGPDHPRLPAIPKPRQRVSRHGVYSAPATVK